MIHIMKYIIPGMMLFVLGSCIKESVFTGETSDDGKVRIELITNVGNYEKPVTRTGTALEDSAGTTPWVLVFSGSDDNAVFSEAQQSIISGGKTFVTLTKTTTACRLLVLANAPANFQNAQGTSYSFNQSNLTTQLTGKTLSAAVDNLLTSPQLDIIQTTVPYTPNQTIPMSALMPAVSAINGSTVINSTGVAGGSALLLNRIVAKVTVDASGIANFILSGATVVGAPRNGALAQLGTAIKSNADNLAYYLTSTTGDGVTGIAPATNNTTVANPVYLYESQESATSVIIKGSYNGTASYYRLAFMSNGGLVNVYRNKHYLFSVTSVTEVGYLTMEEAMVNPPSNAIKMTLSVTDPDSWDILDNGEYYLGMSNSQITIYDDPVARNGIPAVTVTTNASSPIRLTADSDVATLIPVVPATPTVFGGLTSWKVTMNLTAAFTTGRIVLNLGNLVKTITVTRIAQQVPAAGATYHFVTPHYVSGYVAAASAGWLSLSFFSDPSTAGSSIVTDSDPGPMYVFVAANSTSGSRAGAVYLSRNDGQGCIMLYFVQAG